MKQWIARHWFAICMVLLLGCGGLFLFQKRLVRSAQEQQEVLFNYDQEPVPCDTDALPCARETLKLLWGTAARQKVIFGHQNENDPIHTVRPGIVSDVEDLTGDISGLAGYDTLDLTGCYAGVKNQSQSMDFYTQVSLDAARKGALITLVSHMPNFSSSNIVKIGEEYDFYNCRIEDTRDSRNDCAREILPGGKYHPAFNAYLDLIAQYGLRLQEEQIAVQFRPFHEGNGSWFWWGGEHTDVDTYIALFRYTKDYLTEKGVHNFLYVYSPNGPFWSVEECMERYPGDDYVDVIAVDYYNGGYDEVPSQYREDFFNTLQDTCRVVSQAAYSHGKIPAISETGIWVMKPDYSGNNGLLEKGNPMKGKAWYTRVGEIAAANYMPYYLVWINSDIANFHVPFRYNEFQKHEMADDFIDFYNEDFSVFARELREGNHSVAGEGTLP